MSDLTLLARLAFATAVVLAPGWLLARALGIRAASAALAWSLALVFVASAITFVAGTSLTLTLVLLLAVGAGAMPFAFKTRGPGYAPHFGTVPGRWWAFAAGVVIGVALWHVAGEIGGDGLFHLARVRKLVDLDALSLDAVSEFPDGGLHPGYAFPLWHVFLGLVATVAGADPGDVVLHEPSVLAPLVLVVTYEAGWMVFRRVAPAASAAAGAVALVALAPGHGGAYTALALPATFARQALVPAALALAFATIRAPSRVLLASTAAASLALAIVHPTYALFLWIPFGGFLLVRWAWTRLDLRSGALVLGALVVPAAVFFAWLLPVVRDTASVRPDEAERARALAQYAGQLVVDSPDRFHLAPEVLGRAGAVAVAALLLVPLAGLSARRRWAAYVVGGSLAVLGLMLVSALFTPFADAVSVSQARRAAGFLPFAVAFGGGAQVVTALLGSLAAPLALVAGIVFQLAYPGDFDYVLTDGGPAAATWIAAGGAVAALAFGFLQRAPRERAGWLAAAAFLLPVVAHALWNWSPAKSRQPSPLSAGLTRELRALPAGSIVYSDPEASYRIAAAAPLYICVAPPGHVADTKDNRPRERVDEFRRFASSGDLAIPRACGARWLVVDRSRFDVAPDAPLAYRDARWTLYRLSGGP
jgi:hypothetical protein